MIDGEIFSQSLWCSQACCFAKAAQIQGNSVETPAALAFLFATAIHTLNFFMPSQHELLGCSQVIAM